MHERHRDRVEEPNKCVIPSAQLIMSGGESPFLTLGAKRKKKCGAGVGCDDCLVVFVYVSFSGVQYITTYAYA